MPNGGRFLVARLCTIDPGEPSQHDSSLTHKAEILTVKFFFLFTDTGCFMALLPFAPAPLVVARVDPRSSSPFTGNSNPSLLVPQSQQAVEDPEAAEFASLFQHA